MSESEAVQFSKVAAEALRAALEVGRQRMPEASDARLLLLAIRYAAVGCARHGVVYADLECLVSSAFEHGRQLPPFPHTRSAMKH